MAIVARCKREMRALNSAWNIVLAKHIENTIETSIPIVEYSVQNWQGCN